MRMLEMYKKKKKKKIKMKFQINQLKFLPNFHKIDEFNSTLFLLNISMN